MQGALEMRHQEITKTVLGARVCLLPGGFQDMLLQTMAFRVTGN
jgi:hypothetical protein